MKSVLIAFLASASTIAGCSDNSVARSVTTQYTVVDAPIVKQGDACYLRVRPATESKAPPRLLRYREPIDNDTIIQSLVDRHNICTLSKAGDVIEESEMVRELAPAK